MNTIVTFLLTLWLCISAVQSLNLNQTLTLPPDDFINGWVDQADGRGTLDIIWSCIFTIFLCSWTALCLNLPAEKENQVQRLVRKLRWMALTIFGPEFTLSFAVGQWASARRSTWAFHLLGYPQWTIRHAFFADMGGLVVQAPDCQPFPINAKQAHFLVAKGYVPFPDIREKVIKDKNKADGLARLATIVQTIWFVLQCIGRGTQHLPITTLELSTLGFVFCTLPTFLCWFHKPLDIDTPIYLKIEASMETIRVESQQPADYSCGRTPLDFVDPTAVYWSYHVMSKIRVQTGARNCPIERSTNDQMIAVGGSFIDVWFFTIVLGFAYVHLAGWNFQTFPTHVERLLWRISSLMIVGLTIYHWAVVYISPWCQGKNATQIPSMVFYPHLVGVVAYGLAQMYLITESFAGLRILPASAFQSVQWSAYIPHI